MIEPKQTMNSERKRSAPRQLMRGVIIVSGSIVAIILFASLLLMLAPVRERVLQYAVTRVDSKIPGSLSVDRIRWPSLGTLEVDSLLWTDNADSLVAAESVRASLRLSSLFSRDIDLHRLELRGVFLDVDAVSLRFSSKEDSVTAGDGEPVNHDREDRSFPRGGSLPGLPSIAVKNFHLATRLVRFSGNELRNATVVGGIDLMRHQSPAVRVDSVVASGSSGWRVDNLALHIDIANGIMEGSGDGAVAPEWPFGFTLAYEGTDQFDLAITRQDDESATDISLLRLQGSLERVGLSVQRINFESRLNVPGTNVLARDPRLKAVLRDFPDLDGVAVGASGVVQLEPVVAVDLDCEFEKNAWLQHGTLALRYDDAGIRFDDLDLAIRDLRVRASASAAEDSVEGRATIEARGARFFDLLGLAEQRPDTMAANVSLQVGGSKSDKRYDVNATVNGVWDGYAVDQSTVVLGLSLSPHTRIDARMAATAMGLSAAVSAFVERDDDWVARIAPVILQESPVRLSALGSNRNGVVRYSPEKGSFLIKKLTVVGDLGNVVLNGNVGKIGGTYSADFEWPEPPEILMAKLGLDARSADSLRVGWRTEQKYRLNIDGALSQRDSTSHEIAATFVLPGLAALAALLPDSARVDDLGPIEGSLKIEAVSRLGATNFHAMMSVDSTDWVSSIASVRGVGKRIIVDSVDVSVPGAEVALAGAINDGVTDLQCTLQIVNSSFLKRFIAGVPNLQLRGDVEMRGPAESPEVDANISAAVRGKTYSVPEIKSEIVYGRDVRVVIEAPRGITGDRFQLATVRASFESSGTDEPWDGRYSLLAKNNRMILRQSMRFNPGVDTIAVSVDTLEIELVEKDLKAQRPFFVQMIPALKELTVENLDLSGSLGTVQLSGFAFPDSSNLRGEISIAVPDLPPSLQLLEDVLPDNFEARLEATGRHNVDAEVRLDGFRLADGREPTFHCVVDGDSARISATVSLEDSAGKLLDGAATLPARFVLYPPSLHHLEGVTVVDAKVSDFALSMRKLGGLTNVPANEFSRISGEFHARGESSSLYGVTVMRIVFPDWPKLADHEFVLEAGFGPFDATHLQLNEDWPQISQTWNDGFKGSMSVVKQGRTILAGSVDLPLEFSTAPPAARMDKDGSLRIEIRASELNVHEFDPLLPPDIGLDGRCNLEVIVDGPVDNPSIDARFSSKGLSIAQAERAQARTNFDLQVSGTAKEPLVKGDIKVSSALIRIPETPKELHAVEGEAILLVQEDTTSVIVTEESLESDINGAKAVRAKYDVAITIPDAFWVRGRGLDVELQGDLHITQKDDKPTVVGELRAVRGTLLVLGRVLDLERGTIIFHEGEPHPSLDIVLATTVESTKIRISIAGTTEKPSLLLTSEPELDESDIMSVLLLGKPYDELDDAQADLVRQRTTQMIASLGLVALQGQMSGQMGVDVITVKQGSTGSDQGAALAFGKYINPKLLLSYAQALDQATSSYVSLEYFLRGRFKIESTFSGDNKSSLGIQWAKDY